MSKRANVSETRLFAGGSGRMGGNGFLWNPSLTELTERSSSDERRVKNASRRVPLPGPVLDNPWREPLPCEEEAFSSPIQKIKPDNFGDILTQRGSSVFYFFTSLFSDMRFFSFSWQTRFSSVLHVQITDYSRENDSFNFCFQLSIWTNVSDFSRLFPPLCLIKSSDLLAFNISLFLIINQILFLPAGAVVR